MLVANWVLTIPKSTAWEEWLREVRDARARGLFLFYRTPFLLNCNPGDRCFIVWDGRVRGWLPIVRSETRNGFICKTTNRGWRGGHYLVRKPEFHPIDGPELKGFRGVRRLPMNFLEAIIDRPGS